MNTVRRAALGILALALAGSLAACAVPPRSSYVNEAGQTVTVSWADFPARAYVDTESVLAGPTVEEVADHSTRLLVEAREALEAEFGLTGWSVRGEEGWFPEGGNDYGGTSMLHIFNSSTWEAPAEIPGEDWERVVDAVAEVAERYGLDTRRIEELDDRTGTWMRAEVLMRGDAEWLSVVVQDAALDPRALAEAEERGWQVAGVQLFYGISTIREADRAEFERRADPFRGLEFPYPRGFD